MVLSKVFSRHQPADVGANQYLLQNRASDRWKNTKYIVPGNDDSVDWLGVGKQFVDALNCKLIKKPE